MLTYKKYISKAILYPFLALSVGLTSIVWITQILKLLYLIDKGVGFTEFCSLMILILPSLFFMISPLVSVLSVIFVYNKLQENREIITLKASGLSNFSITKPALTFAFIVTLFVYYISSYLMPLSYNKLKSGLSNVRENYLSSIIDEKKFNQISKNITVYIDKKNSDSTLENIILFDNEIPENRTILFAKMGKINLQKDRLLFQLEDGFRQSFDKNHKLTKLHFDNLVMEIRKTINSGNNRNKTSLELYINEMIWPNDELSEERKNRLIIDGHQRLVWPLFNYCFVFLALTMFLGVPYTKKSNLKQIIYTCFPLTIIAYFHFTLQKIAYQKPFFIFACYANLLCCIIFSIWKSRKRTI